LLQIAAHQGFYSWQEDGYASRQVALMGANGDDMGSLEPILE
jgi:hypothetical protein